MSDQGEPDLETLAPAQSAGSPYVRHGDTEPHPRGRGPVGAVLAGLVVLALVVGFGVTTIVLDVGDSGKKTTSPGTTPATTPANAGTTSPSAAPADRDESVLPGLIVNQRDVGAGETVRHLEHGADLTIATLDLCNGTFPSEKLRTARRQVALYGTGTDVQFSTEAVLYRAPADGAQAFRELKSVAASCPAKPVTSPVGEGTATTKFRAAPDGAWPRLASVERLAFDFVTTDASSKDQTHSFAVYLRRGRVLMGLYFAQPDASQPAIDGRAAIPGIVAVFEARMARLPAAVVNR